MTMKTRFAVLVVATLSAAAALAQQPSRDGIAQLRGVKGNVLLSREAGLAAGGEAARVVEHTRVITTAGSEVVVEFDNGCRVHLKENQRFEVDSRKPCAALIASVESILVQPAGVALAGGAGAAGGFWSVVPAIGGAAIGAAIISGASGNPPPPTPLSPS
jgi:hypothetical protein